MDANAVLSMRRKFLISSEHTNIVQAAQAHTQSFANIFDVSHAAQFTCAEDCILTKSR